jgi:DNA invertase Pin-like site-specific DNA recombinase
MLIGYSRVSTDDQKFNLQQNALHMVGCEKIFEDYLSGARATRLGLTSALEMARSGESIFYPL